MMRPYKQIEDKKSVPEFNSHSFADYQVRYNDLVRLSSSSLYAAELPVEFGERAIKVKDMLRALEKEAEINVNARYFVLKYGSAHSEHNNLHSKNAISISLKSDTAKWKAELLNDFKFGMVDSFRFLCFGLHKPSVIASSLFLTYALEGDPDSTLSQEIKAELERYRHWLTFARSSRELRQLDYSLRLIKRQICPKISKEQIYYGLLDDFISKYLKSPSVQAGIEEKVELWVESYNRSFAPQNLIPGFFNNPSPIVTEPDPGIILIQTLEDEIQKLEVTLEAKKQALQALKEDQAKKQELRPSF